MTFVNHGEPAAAQALHDAIVERLRWPCTVAELGRTVDLEAL
jgi:hypothetical protein